jgi:hypothetical protein
MLPFRFAHPMRMRPLSVGRVDNAFHPATMTLPEPRLSVKKKYEKIRFEKQCSVAGPRGRRRPHRKR